MTDDSGLSQTEAAQWDAIVSSEWPVEAAILTTQPSSASVPPGGGDGTAQQRSVTLYRPRRPRLTPVAVGVLALATSAWLTIQVLIPAYQRAGQASISQSERAIEVQALTVATALTALAVVVAAGCFGVWVAATARYRLRRSSCRLVASQSTPVTRYVRPPSPATAASWILLLLAASTAAGWAIPLQLERTGGSPPVASEALHLAGVGGLAWLAVFLLCMLGLTTWAARETRHRLRRAAAMAMTVESRGA
jgi:hypothetical protein